jgi:hypothetical protein
MRHPDVAATLKVDTEFPYPTVLSLYLNPVVSQHNPSQPLIRPSFCGVSIDWLANLCTECFGWEGEFLARKFFNVVLSGAINAIIYAVGSSPPFHHTRTNQLLARKSLC